MVIPIFNEGESIERLIKSIAVQDYRQIEVIIIDGAKKYNSADVAEFEFLDSALRTRSLRACFTVL